MNTTGYSSQQFNEILQYLIENDEFEMRNSKERKVSQALAIYLYWLKTGLDQQSIACHFGTVTRRQVGHYCEQIRNCLIRNYVPKHLGAKHLTREQFLLHNSEVSKSLFNLEDNRLSLIADGTYCYIQKSSNFFFQRVQYSGQKKRHLMKPFVICCTDGYIIDIYGLYNGTQNDASIFESIISEETDFVSLLEHEDVFILDRGFRDCIDIIKENGWEPKMPALLGKSQKQLSTREANESRMVTKCRWPVEVDNGFLKRSFRALREVQNQCLPHTLADYRIGAALINHFHRRLFADGDSTDIA